jgi:hypothetical protein
MQVKPKGKSPFIRHGHRWEDNIKIDFKETWLGGEGLD